MKTIEDYYYFEQIDAIRKKEFDVSADAVFNALSLPNLKQKKLEQWQVEKQPLLFGWIESYFQVKEIVFGVGSGVVSIIYRISLDNKKYFIKSIFGCNHNFSGLLVNHYVIPVVQAYTQIPVINTQLIQLDADTLIEVAEEAPGMQHSIKDLSISDAIFQSLGGYLAQLKLIPVEGFGPLSIEALVQQKQCIGLHSSWSSYLLLNLEKHLMMCQDSGLLMHAQVCHIQKLYQDNQISFDQINPILLHRDIGFHNLICQQDSIAAVLDWEEVLIGDPIFQIVYFSISHPDESTRRLLQTYSLIDRQNPAQVFRFYAYQLRFYLALMSFKCLSHEIIHHKERDLLQGLYQKLIRAS